MQKDSILFADVLNILITYSIYYIFCTEYHGNPEPTHTPYTLGILSIDS